MRPNRQEPLGVDFTSREPITVISHYSPDIELGYLLLQRTDNQAPPQNPIHLSPPREIEQPSWPVLSARAAQITQQHLLAAAVLLDALTEGPDEIATIVSRREAAGRATPRTD